MDTREGLRVLACHYRLYNQLNKTNEELQELHEAIEGYINGDDTVEHILEEIADVEVMTAQLKLLLDGEMEVEKIKVFKVNRQLKRIKNEE